MMKTWINYHHLYYFKTIAEEGSVSKAATKLSLGQPTLSAQLKMFEETLGIPLFIRDKKRMVLTEQGRVALEYAKSIFSMGSEMLEVLNDRTSPTRTHLQIGALDSVPKQITLELTKHALAGGNCHVTTVEGTSDDLIQGLAAHRIDLMVTDHISNEMGTRGFYHRSFAKSPIGIYGAAHYKKLRNNFPKSILGQNFILSTHDSKLRHDFEHWMKSKSIHVNIIAETQDIGLKKLMAEDGVGMVVTAAHSVSRQIEKEELFEIGTLSGIHEELFLVSAERKIQNPVAQDLLAKFRIET